MFKCNFILVAFFSLYTGKVHYLVLLPHMPSQDCLNVNNVIVKKLKSICWAHTSVLVLNLNVTGVTELHVNGAVLNHIKSVNTSNTNVTIVIINHQKNQLKNNDRNIKGQINIRFHLPKPHHITHSQSWPVLTRVLVTFPDPEWYSLILNHSVSTFICTIQLLLNPLRLKDGNEVQLDYCTCVTVQEAPLWSSWTQGPQILTYSMFTGPPPPQHKMITS